ncbi:MAG: S8 family serine peptidase [Quadrisphaera sp.]
MASIIGTADAASRTRTGAPSVLDSTSQLGVAPDAGLLALKLANTDGSTDVSQVIAGLDWVVEHRRDNGMDVRVVNLSFGTDGLQSYQVDPLAAAVERAWQRGVVVVVSAGNEGPDSGGLSNPAIDPYVIAVGATSPSTSVLSSVDERRRAGVERLEHAVVGVLLLPGHQRAARRHRRTGHLGGGPAGPRLVRRHRAPRGARRQRRERPPPARQRHVAGRGPW